MDNAELNIRTVDKVQMVFITVLYTAK